VDLYFGQVGEWDMLAYIWAQMSQDKELGVLKSITEFAIKQVSFKIVPLEDYGIRTVDAGANDLSELKLARGLFGLTREWNSFKESTKGNYV